MFRNAIIILLSLLVIAGWSYWIAAWLCVRAKWRTGRAGFFRGGFPESQTSPSKESRVVPARSETKGADSEETQIRVSILKPVKAANEFSYDNFASFCRQDFVGFEILFAALDANDPALAVVRRLQADFPEIPIRFFVADELGVNPKCANLHRLATEARAEILVLSDDDMRVGPDYLAAVTWPLADKMVGWVTCPYRGIVPRGFAAHLESLHMDSVFLPAVCLAARLNERIGMGATIALRRADLFRTGGFAAIADHLMDDYQLVSLIAGLGRRGYLASHIVDSTLGNVKFATLWHRETRWARGIRVTTPMKYWGLLLTYPTIWAVVLLLVMAFDRWAVLFLALTLILRWLITLDIRRRITGTSLAAVGLVPVRDFLSFAVWCGGTFGSGIEWRGRNYTLERSGRLRPADESHEAGGLFSRAVRRLDAFLRKRQGIFEYDNRPECILRLSIGTCGEDVTLSDGTKLSADERVGELHLYNEHIPPIGEAGTNMAWAALAQDRVRQSLATLARVTETDPRFAEIRAFVGHSTFATRRGVRQLQRMATRMHFDVMEPPPKRGLFHQLHELGENLLLWALVRVYNPRGLRGAKLMRARHNLYISRATLLKWYGPREASAATTDAIAATTDTTAAAADVLPS